jgi:hypothetical protein
MVVAVETAVGVLSGVPMTTCAGPNVPDRRSSTMSVYNWIREGVRQAVLSGFSDAIEQVGVPTQGQQLNPQLVSVLRQAPAAIETVPQKVIVAAPSRKRLGKSLEQSRHATGDGE